MSDEYVSKSYIIWWNYAYYHDEAGRVDCVMFHEDQAQAYCDHMNEKHDGRKFWWTGAVNRIFGIGEVKGKRYDD